MSQRVACVAASALVLHGDQLAHATRARSCHAANVANARVQNADTAHIIATKLASSDRMLAAFRCPLRLHMGGAWPSFFARIMDEGFGERVKVMNMAVPATSCKWLSHQARNVVKSRGLVLTPCDIVLLDFSVNDADASNMYDNKESDLASSIVAIHEKLLPATTILLKTYPHGIRKDKHGPPRGTPEFLYHRAYEDVSARHGIPLFDVAALFAASGIEHSTIRWPHPPWPTHLLVARAAAAFIDGASRCMPSTCSIPASFAKGGSVTSDQHRESQQGVDERPKDCDKEESSLLAAQACFQQLQLRQGNEAQEGSPLKCPHWTITSSVAMPGDASGRAHEGVSHESPLAMWRLFEDRKGKAGWISETTDSWLRLKMDSKRWLAFGYRKLRLHIGFMRTFANAGMFKITYCNAFVANISTFWNDSVSLQVHAAWDLPACGLFFNVGHVVLRHVGPSPGQHDAQLKHTQGLTIAAGKVKLTSIALCPQD